MTISTILDDVIEKDISVKPPIAVLKELAQDLEQRTHGLLACEVRRNYYGNDEQIAIDLKFHITAPSLNNYSYHVFSISHGFTFYPLDISVSNQSSRVAKTQEELEEILKEIFSSSEVKKVINGLLMQIKSA